MMFFPKILFILSILFLLDFPEANGGSTCATGDFKESLSFLHDYLACISGSSNDCTTILDSVGFNMTASLAAGTGAVALSEYSARKINSIIKGMLVDAKKKARDENYAKEIEKQVGGQKLDHFIAENGDTPERALAQVKSKIQAMESLGNLTKEQQAAKDVLTEYQAHLTNRIGYAKENANIIKSKVQAARNINISVLEELAPLDQKSARLQAQIQSRTFSDSAERELKTQLKKLEEQRRAVMASFQSIETRLEPVASRFNPSVGELVRKLEAKKQAQPQLKKFIQDEIDALKKLKIQADPKALGRYPRLMFTANADIGMSISDANGAYKLMPEWGRQNRLMAMRAFPELLQKAFDENHRIFKDLPALHQRLAELEHERYRKDTQKRLIDTYEYERKISHFSKADYPDVKLPVGKNGEAFNKYVELNPVQQEALKKVKANWLKVDVPFAQLADNYKEMTLSQVVTTMDTVVPVPKKWKRLYEYFLRNPRVGILARKATRLTGGGIGLATILFEYNDMEELALSGIFMTKHAQENWKGIISSHCRLPEEMTLGAKNVENQPSKWFCGCEKFSRDVVEVSKQCQVSPTDLDPETRQQCLMAMSSGRDRDLLMAKALKESKDKDPKAKDPKMLEIFKSGMGCDVLKNYPSHCHYTTNDLTTQGLYFMSIIKKEHLESEVTELCPDVCSHWVDVANNKLKEISSALTAYPLPKTKKENKARESCDPQFYSGPPPTDPVSAAKWKDCQPSIQCRSDGSVRVNVMGTSSGPEYYEYKYDLKTISLKSAKNYRLNRLSTPDKHGLSVPSTANKPLFSYNFDDAGGLEKIELYDWNTGSIKESIPPEDIFGRFEEYAYNASTHFLTGRDTGEYAVSKRFDVLITGSRVKKYCCQNEWTCEDDDGQPLFSKQTDAVK